MSRTPNPSFFKELREVQDAWQTTCDARVAEMIAEGLLP